MDATPTPPQKRTTRGKSIAIEPTADSPKLSKGAVKPVRRAKVSAEQSEAAVSEALATPELNERIATTAYFLAAARNFEPGHELEDWLEAERRIRDDG